MTAHELESTLNGGASLFLIRITAFLRLSFLLDLNLGLQLSAISIFINASSSGGLHYLTEFLETGGILTLLDIISHKEIKESHKASAIEILFQLTSCGKQIVDYIRESQGIKTVFECICHCFLDETMEIACSLLVELSKSHPKSHSVLCKLFLNSISEKNSPKLQLTIGKAYRQCLFSRPKVHSVLIDAFFILLKSQHLPLQFEGYELIKTSLDAKQSIHQIVHNLVDCLEVVVDEDDRRKSSSDVKRRKSIVEIEKLKTSKKHIYSMQTLAVKLLAYFFSNLDWLLLYHHKILKRFYHWVVVLH